MQNIFVKQNQDMASKEFQADPLVGFAMDLIGTRLHFFCLHAEPSGERAAILSPIPVPGTAVKKPAIVIKAIRLILLMAGPFSFIS
jgi:hypothetical protein